MPRVSIVTISFNQATFLERAIRSVLEQDYANLEYIVVDPGSTDRSREIIERYRPHISKIILEPDSGPANGLNNGFAAASGDIFGYLNADDAYLPGAISKAVAALQSRPEVAMVYGHSYIVNRQGEMVRRSHSVPFNLRRFAYGGVLIMQQSTFIRRQAFEEVGGFNEENRSCWDYELVMDMALRGCKLAMVDEFWSLYAIYPGSITASLNQNRKFETDRARMFRRMTNRDYDKTSRLLFTWARLEKLILNPMVPLRRIIDKTFGRPALPNVALRPIYEDPAHD
jgi:glycosyltransferase involved in cell wall biosynthesis